MNLFSPEEVFARDVAATTSASSRGQDLAETLVADYTLPDRAWLPSAAIVALLGEFGVASGAARTTISRMARRSVLEQSRHAGSGFELEIMYAARQERGPGRPEMR